MSDVVTGQVDVRHLAPEQFEGETDGLGLLDAEDEVEEGLDEAEGTEIAGDEGDVES